MKQMGYLIVDHRASPGLTEEQARMNGYTPRLVREGAVFEADTMTCAHCKRVVIKNPERMRERAHCRACNHYICDECAIAAMHPDYAHKSFEAAMHETFERNLRAEQFSPLTIRSLP